MKKTYAATIILLVVGITMLAIGTTGMNTYGDELKEYESTYKQPEEDQIFSEYNASEMLFANPILNFSQEPIIRFFTEKDQAQWEVKTDLNYSKLTVTCKTWEYLIQNDSTMILTCEAR